MKKIITLLLATVCFTGMAFSQASAGEDRLLSNAELRNIGWYDNLEEALANPDQVYKLSLSDQNIKALPPEIGQLKNLQVLSLSNCGIKRLPEEMKNLKKLQSLTLYGNRLRYLPIEFRELPELQVLYLGRNKLTEIPYWVRNMRSLRKLDVSMNPITPAQVITARRLIPKVDLTY